MSPRDMFCVSLLDNFEWMSGEKGGLWRGGKGKKKGRKREEGKEKSAVKWPFAQLNAGKEI